MPLSRAITLTRIIHPGQKVGFTTNSRSKVLFDAGGKLLGRRNANMSSKQPEERSKNSISHNFTFGIE